MEEGAEEVCVQESPVSSLLTHSAPRKLVPLQLTGLKTNVSGGKVYVDPQRWLAVCMDCCLLLKDEECVAQNGPS